MSSDTWICVNDAKASNATSRLTEAFFKAMNEGSVTELKIFLKNSDPELSEIIAKSYNSVGETPLLLAIKGNNKKMVKFLVQCLNVPIAQSSRFVWKGLDYLSASPLFAAIISDHTPDLSIIDFLISSEVKMYTSSVFLDSILSSPILCSQKIEALELMGAAYMFKHQLRARQFGMECWTEATSLRQLTVDGQKISPTLSERAKNVFSNTSEFMTLEQLQEINSRLNDGSNVPEIQAFLVIQRIISHIHPGPHPFFVKNVLQIGEDVRFRSQGQYLTRAVNIAMLILDVFEAHEWADAVNLEWPFAIIIDSLSLIGDCFREMQQNPPNSSEQEFLVENFIKSVSYSSSYAMKLPQETDVDTKVDVIASSIYRIVISLARMEPQLSEQMRKLFKTCLSPYIRFINGRDGVSSVLHMAVTVTCANNLPNEILKLFLDAGANPNAIDEQGHTALHILSFYPFSRSVVNTAQLLFKAGAHLDQPNSNGETALDCFKRMSKTQVGPIDPILNSLINSVLPLTCYCAQMILKQRVSFLQLPKSLKSFIESHDVHK